MFRTVLLSIIRSFSLYTQQWCMSYMFADSLRAGSGWKWFGSAAADPNQCCVQWKIPDDGQRNCPKHVDFYSENKFEKLVHLVGLYKNLSRCTVTWTSDTYNILIYTRTFRITFLLPYRPYLGAVSVTTTTTTATLLMSCCVVMERHLLTCHPCRDY